MISLWIMSSMQNFKIIICGRFMQILKKETGTWKWGILCLIFLAPFFFLTYGFANHYASQLPNVPSIVYGWEKHIPLWS